MIRSISYLLRQSLKLSSKEYIFKKFTKTNRYTNQNVNNSIVYRLDYMLSTHNYNHIDPLK
jgi:hypothetical protein